LSREDIGLDVLAAQATRWRRAEIADETLTKLDVAVPRPDRRYRRRAAMTKLDEAAKAWRALAVLHEAGDQGERDE
jgi:hypothetical protein